MIRCGFALVLILCGCSAPQSALESSCVEYSALCESDTSLSLERGLSQDWLTVASTVPMARESCDTAAACWEQVSSLERGASARNDRLLLARVARWKAEVLAALEQHAEGELEGSCEELEQACGLYLRALSNVAPLQRALAYDLGVPKVRDLRSSAEALLEDLGCR